MSQSANADVKQMALRLFQQWALAFQSKRELSFLVDVYNELKNSGKSTISRYHSPLTIRHQIPRSPRRDILPPLQHHHRPGLGRFRCLHALSHHLYIHQSQAPLPQLRSRIRPGVFVQIHGAAAFRHHDPRPSVRLVLCQRTQSQAFRSAAGGAWTNAPQSCRL